MPVTIFLSCQLQGCHYYQVFNSLNSNQQIFLSSNTRLFGIVEKMGPVALGNTLFRMDFSVVGRVAEWNKSRFTAGVSYTANRNRSTYENLGGRGVHQRQDKAYIFAEYFQRYHIFTYTACIGMQYTGFSFRETDQGNHSWNLRPQATVTYSVNSNHRLRLGFASWQTAPSLSHTNIAPQQIDGFQWQIGNPDLKTATSYKLNFRYLFSLPRVDGTFGIRVFSSPNAIAPCLFWDGDRLITTFENSLGLKNIVFSLSPQVEIIPAWLTAAGSVEYRAEQMKGKRI